MNSFSELSLSATLQNNLLKNGFVEPTAVQVASIPPSLAGRDVVATAQTGTGKTLAFVLPLLHSLTREPLTAGVQALILSPTRELAIQIHETVAKIAEGTGVRTAVVVGGLSEQMQLNHIRQGAQVVIATPGRLTDFLKRRLVKLKGARYFILDEADRMLDMGFLPTIEAIIKDLPAERQTMFLSATIEPTVAHLIQKHVRNPVRVAVGSTTKPHDQIDLHLYEVEQDRKIGLLQYMLTKEEGLFLVFARTKHGADRLAKKLSMRGFKTASIHGDRSQNQRNQALKGFQGGYYRVLVATDVASRGIHVEGIAHVVNFDLPQAPEDFIHRAGRTGRAGAKGVASTFCTRGERKELLRIEKALKVRMVPQMVANEIEAEKHTAAPVVVMPTPQPHKRRFQGRPEVRKVAKRSRFGR